MKRPLVQRPNRQNNIDRKGRLECPYAKTTFQRQTPFMVEVTGQSQSFPRNFKNHEKKCQRSQFFEKFWLLSLPTSLRAITLLPVLDRIAQNKSWNIFKKLRAGLTFLKRSLFDSPPPPPTCKIFSHKHIWRM